MPSTAMSRGPTRSGATPGASPRKRSPDSTTTATAPPTTRTPRPERPRRCGTSCTRPSVQACLTGTGRVGTVPRPVRRVGTVTAVLLLLVCASARADVTVNSSATDDDDGFCQPLPAGDCTLREAIAHTTAGEVVTVPA